MGVQAKSLADTVAHDLYLKQTAETREAKQTTHPQVGFSYHDQEHEMQYEFILWSVAKYKAFMRGISEGIYNDENVIINEECLNVDAIEAMYNLAEGFYHGRGVIDTSLKVFTAMYVFMINLQTNCRTYQFLYDTAAYCFRSDQCDSFDIYIYNLGVNLH